MTGIRTKILTVITFRECDSGWFLFAFVSFSEFSNFSTFSMSYLIKKKVRPRGALEGRTDGNHTPSLQEESHKGQKALWIKGGKERGWPAYTFSSISDLPNTMFGLMDGESRLIQNTKGKESWMDGYFTQWLHNVLCHPPAQTEHLLYDFICRRKPLGPQIQLSGPEQWSLPSYAMK